MKLIRHVNLPKSVRRVCDGPCAGGTFWALDGAHDLPPGPFAFGDLKFMIANGSLWMSDAANPAGWMVVTSPSDLPNFQADWVDDYDACTVRRHVSPFMPQLFFVPRNRRGRRFLVRTTDRAFTRRQ